MNADNVSTIYRKAAVITQKRSYSETAKGPSTAMANASANSIETRLAYLENAVATILDRLIEKDSTPKRTTRPNPTPQTPQRPISLTQTQKAPTHKTPEKRPPTQKKPVHPTGIDTSIHNPDNNTATNINTNTNSDLQTAKEWTY